MSDVRTEIDRIDATLVDLIAERFGYVDRAWQLKMTTREGAVVQWRIQQVIDRVKARAAEKNLPPEMIELVHSVRRRKAEPGAGCFREGRSEPWVLTCSRTCRCSKCCCMVF